MAFRFDLDSVDKGGDSRLFAVLRAGHITLKCAHLLPISPLETN